MNGRIRPVMAPCQMDLRVEWWEMQEEEEESLMPVKYGQQTNANTKAGRKKEGVITERARIQPSKTVCFVVFLFYLAN